MLLSKKDIKITIKNDKLKLNIYENYHNIHTKLNDYFHGNEKDKFINYLKKYLKVDYTKPLNNSKYLLSFIYKNNAILEGYDSFLTFAYINILNKVTPFFYINGRKYENTLPTLDIYDFSNMKNVKLRMTQKQEKIVSNLLKDNKTLLIILLKRYEPRFITKRNTNFILNKQILDYLSNSSDYSQQLPIIDFDKYLNDDVSSSSTTSNNDDIETNLFYYASLEASNNIYVKLVKYYLLGQRKHLNKKLLEFSLYQICNINKDLDKSKIETRLIKELSNANIEIDLKIIKEFIHPKCDTKLKMDETIILELLSYYHKKISFNTMIRYLSKLYKYDTNQRLQIQIQDFIEPLKLIKGGEGETTSQTTSQETPPVVTPNIKPTSSSIYKLLPVNTIRDLENNISKIVYILEKKLINIDDVEKEINKIIRFDINNDIKIHINTALESNKKSITKSIENQDKTILKLAQQITDLESKYSALSSTTAGQERETRDAYQREISKARRKKEEEETIKDKYLKELDNIERGIDYIATINKDLIFEKFSDYYQSSKQYINIMELLYSIRYIADNNNIKEYITKIITGKKNTIDALKKEIENKKTTFENNIKATLKTSNEILKDFFNKISKIDDIDDGIMKTLKKTYITPDILGDNPNDPTYIITQIGDTNMNILTEFLTSVTELSDITYPNFISKVSNERMRGGGKIENEYKGGDKIEDYRKELDNKKKTILNELNNISDKLKKFKANQETNKNVETKMASVGFIDEVGNNVFDRLITAYDDNIKNKKMPYEVARNLFYSKAKNLNLDPSVELEITQNDKGIFCAVVYVIRLLALYICNLLIDNNKFTALTSILKSYVLWYIVILLIFVVIINIDAFKLRILINYLNMHVNSFGIMVHIILMLIFVYLIYLMTINILGNDQPSLELSENEKIKLKYKLELLTAVVFIFICILVFII